MNEEREWGESPVKAAELSKEEYAELVESVVETGKARRRTGALECEADFLAGAMVVMERLGISCPVWPILILSGRSVLEEE